jgi:hypothetical protein
MSVPERWQDVIELLLVPIAWVPRLQEALIAFFLNPAGPWITGAKYVFLLFPALLGVAAVWITLLALYTLPFRARRVRFVAMMLLAWWDAARAVTLYWAGVLRVAAVGVGWVASLAALVVRLAVEAIHRLAMTPIGLTAQMAHRYVMPGTPWIALLTLVAWSVLEAAVFTYTMLPAVSTTLSDLAGGVEASRFTGGVLYAFLLLLVMGSFACLQTLTDAVRKREWTFAAQMLMVQLLVMFFEVAFLYRQLVGALTPWAGAPLGPGMTALVASLGWLGTRAMTWFLFARYGTEPLLAVIARRPLTDTTAVAPVSSFPARSAAWWQAASDDLQRELSWLHARGDQLVEYVALPVLQLVAVALNFGTTLVASRPVLQLPFKTLKEVTDARDLLAAYQPTPRKQPTA